MADLSPLLGEERKSDFGAVRSVDDPTETSRSEAKMNRDVSLDIPSRHIAAEWAEADKTPKGADKAFKSVVKPRKPKG
jgi:hypothetical protein